MAGKLFGVKAFATITAALAAAAFLALAYAVGHGYTVSFDANLREFAYSHSSSGLTGLFQIISFTGKLWFLVGLGGVVTAGFLYWRKYRWAALFLITMGGEILLETGSKALFARARPEPFFGLPPAESYSFPSGHALGSLCFYGILAMLISSRSDTHRRRWIVSLAAVWILLIGFSRVYLGMHYPTDVLAGYLLGISWLSALTVFANINEKGG